MGNVLSNLPLVQRYGHCLLLAAWIFVNLQLLPKPAWGQLLTQSNCSRLPEQFWQPLQAQTTPPFTITSPTASGERLLCNGGDADCSAINLATCERAAKGEEKRSIRFTSNLNTPFFTLSGQGVTTQRPATLLWVQVNGNCTVPTDGEIPANDSTRRKLNNNTLQANFTEFRIFSALTVQANPAGRDLIIPNDLSGDENSFALAPILLDPNLGICPQEGQAGKSVSTLAFCYAINLVGTNVGQRSNNLIGTTTQDAVGGLIIPFETEVPAALGEITAKSLNQRIVLQGSAPSIEQGQLEIRYVEDSSQFTAESCASWESFQTVLQDYSSTTGQSFEVEIRDLDPTKRYAFCARAVSCLGNTGPFGNIVIESPHIEYDYFALFPGRLALVQECQQIGAMPLYLLGCWGWFVVRRRRQRAQHDAQE